MKYQHDEELTPAKMKGILADCLLDLAAMETSHRLILPTINKGKAAAMLVGAYLKVEALEERKNKIIIGIKDAEVIASKGLKKKN